MGKFLAFLFVALFVVTLVGACSPSGAMCTGPDECCSGSCNPWAGKCTKVIGPQGMGPQSNNANPMGYGPWRWPWMQAGNAGGWNWPGYQPPV